MTTKEIFSPPATVQRSLWHSPLPYLFGGLAAMLGLIAFALLILACSYRKLSDRVDNHEGGDRDVEAADNKPRDTGKALPVFEEKIVVIMAGDEKPRFLATPMSSRASSFDDDSGKSENKEREKAEIAEKPEQEMDDHEQTTAAPTTTTAATTIGNRETRQTRESQEQNQTKD
ncbi:hypothetical protein F0562_007529 [Nyssa sinensis]|uniref:Uncharacterized protein n=1 Tax=Nyssa sinensis TaxID=561372 RepID=A0A5J5A642_9ASTE|nr:hypothetical protein F0562_007529 [Nyssa sinensis]